MSTFEWKDFFSIGHDEIDSQHRQLFAAAASLRECSQRSGGAAEDELRAAIAVLCAVVRRHFAEEEFLMQSAAYPEFERHKQAHDELIAAIAMHEARILGDAVRLAAETLPVLVGEWLSSHIAFEDQQYAGYVNSYANSHRARFLAAQKQYLQRQGQPERRRHERIRIF